MMNRRQLGQMLGLGTLGAAVAKSPAAMAQDGSLLRLATPVSDLQSLDAHYCIGTQDRTVAAMVYNGLLQAKPGTQDEFVPDLAEDLPEAVENDDGTQTWTFVLKEGIIPHPVDGVEQNPLTVNDILFSFEKAANGDTSAFASDYTGWSFAADEESRTFMITVPKAMSVVMFYPKVANYAGGFIIPQAQYEAVGPDGIITHPVGTGPFKFANYTPQVSVELAAHEEYHGGSPHLAGVEVVYLQDHTSRDFALETGDVQVIHGQWEMSWVDRMNETDGIQADIFGVGDPLFICFDTEHEILQDIRVREALTLAISRRAHVNIAGAPITPPMYGIAAAEHLPGGLSQEEAEEAGVYYTQDVDAAIALLEEAGYGDGFEMDIVSSEMELYRSNYEVLMEEFRQIGVTLNMEVVQHATMHELIREGRNPITIYAAYRPTPDIFLTQFFTSESGGSNFSNFNVDELRDQARVETDVDAQSELWKQASIEILKNYAAFSTHYQNQVYARQESVDYGHELEADLNYYPGINETTTMSGEE